MEVFIDLNKIRFNISHIKKVCEAAGLQVVWVTKGCHSHPSVIEALFEVDSGIIGEVYFSNFERIADRYPYEKMMTQVPTPSQIKDAVARTDIILVSTIDQIRLISDDAQRINKTQKILIMIDTGNLREGILPQNLPDIIKHLPMAGVELSGFGISVGCFGGYIATLKDLNTLVTIAGDMEKCMGKNVDILSIGSGTMLFDLIEAKAIPPEINQNRIGAALLVGEKPPVKEALPPLHRDIFTFKGEISEIYVKPSVPGGETASDAFGKKILFKDKGDRLKALFNFGMVDVDVYDLTLGLEGLDIVGATSNYTICDITDCPEKLVAGDTIEFRMGYSAISRAFGSAQVKKTVI